MITRLRSIIALWEISVYIYKMKSFPLSWNQERKESKTSQAHNLFKQFEYAFCYTKEKHHRNGWKSFLWTEYELVHSFFFSFHSFFSNFLSFLFVFTPFSIWKRTSWNTFFLARQWSKQSNKLDAARINFIFQFHEKCFELDFYTCCFYRKSRQSG